MSLTASKIVLVFVPFIYHFSIFCQEGFNNTVETKQCGGCYEDSLLFIYLVEWFCFPWDFFVLLPQRRYRGKVEIFNLNIS